MPLNWGIRRTLVVLSFGEDGFRSATALKIMLKTSSNILISRVVMVWRRKDCDGDDEGGDLGLVDVRCWVVLRRRGSKGDVSSILSKRRSHGD